MIKLLGTAMIVLGSGSAGFGFARAVRAQLRQRLPQPGQQAVQLRRR